MQHQREKLQQPYMLYLMILMRTLRTGGYGKQCPWSDEFNRARLAVTRDHRSARTFSYGLLSALEYRPFATAFVYPRAVNIWRYTCRYQSPPHQLIDPGNGVLRQSQ